jgi:hypothetical protein
VVVIISYMHNRGYGLGLVILWALDYMDHTLGE